MGGPPTFRDTRMFDEPAERAHSSHSNGHAAEASSGPSKASALSPYFQQQQPQPHHHHHHRSMPRHNSNGSTGPAPPSMSMAGPATDSRFHVGMPSTSSPSFASAADDYPGSHRGPPLAPPPPPYRYSNDSTHYGYEGASGAPSGGPGAGRRNHHADSISSNTSSGSSSLYAGSSSAPPHHHNHHSHHHAQQQHAMESGHPQDSYGRPLYPRHISDGDVNSSTSRYNGPSSSSHSSAAVGGPSSPRASSSTLHNVHDSRKISCLECRNSKVRCSGQAEGGCDRCKRIKRACVFEQHRRGRKPAQVKLHKLEQSVDTIMSALSALQEYKRGKASANDSAAKDEDDDDDDDDHATRMRSKKRRTESDVSNATDGPSSTKLHSEHLHTAKDLPDDDNDNQYRKKRTHSSDHQRLKTFIQDITSHSRSLASPSLTSGEQDREVAIEVTGDLDMAAQELGQPPMSNPLKLLAQASDSNNETSRADTITMTPARQDWEEEQPGEEEDAQKSGPVAVSAGASNKPAKSTRYARDDKHHGVSRRGYWSIGMYSTRPDKGPTLDPISVGIMSTSVASDLYGLYMRHLNATITLLDPFLHTFGYVRSHSALLLSSSCALAARFASHIENAEEIADRLDAHIQDVLLPAVLLKGCRSAEIAQAFIILAAFHSNTKSLDGDRSWSYVGFGIRIAAELDMNARLLSERSGHSMSRSTEQTPNTGLQPDTPASSKAGGGSNASTYDDEAAMNTDEATQRRLRNRERTWCNLWLFEYSLSTHMGRRSTLSQDPVILGVSAGWHLAPYAIKGDEAIVALIGLRRIQIKNAEFFEHGILSNTLHSALPAHAHYDTAAMRFQLDFYNKICRADINSWTSMYVDDREAGGHSYRMKNASLYASYARLILNSYALKCTTDQDLLEPFYQESYGAAMTYLTLYSERYRASGLTYVHNSSVVTVAYVAVFALKLCSLDAERYPYIDSKRVFDHVRELIDALTRAGSVTPWRNGAASSYAPYLSAVLERVKRNAELERRRRMSSETQDGKGLDEQATGADAFKRPPNAEASNQATPFVPAVGGRASQSNLFQGVDPFTSPDAVDMQTNATTRTASTNAAMSTDGSTAFTSAPMTSGPTPGRYETSTAFPFTSEMPVSSSEDAAVVAAAAAAAKLQPEALTFFAGPSGVQAATILDDLAVNEEYLRFGISPHHTTQKNQFLEGSLFGDMSVFLNASFGNDPSYTWNNMNSLSSSTNAATTS